MSASAFTATVAGWPGAGGIRDQVVEPRLTTGFCGLSAEATSIAARPAEGAPITGFKDVGLPQMRKEDSTAAEALTSVKVKISDVYFLIALAKGETDTARNLDLMQTRAWFDFPLLLNDERIAKVVFQKSPEGQAMLEKAFEAWK